MITLMLILVPTILFVALLAVGLYSAYKTTRNHIDEDCSQNKAAVHQKNPTPDNVPHDKDKARMPESNTAERINSHSIQQNNQNIQQEIQRNIDEMNRQNVINTINNL